MRCARCDRCCVRRSGGPTATLPSRHRGTTSWTRSRCTMRPVEARRRWPAPDATTWRARGLPRQSDRHLAAADAYRYRRGRMPDEQLGLIFDPTVLLDAEVEVLARTARGEFATFAGEPMPG